MTIETGAPAASRLRRLAQRASAGAVAPAVPAEERCELCSAPIPPEHRHMLDLSARRLLCACRACSVLFDREAAGAGGRHYRLLPDRYLHVENVASADEWWAALSIPVEMAFFFFDSAAGRVVALYPGPMGATESLLPLTAWEELATRNPVLARLQPDVEALLVNRTRGAREHWLVPVDACYTLVGVIRTHWKGLSGGEEVWAEIGRFFDGLRERAVLVRSDGAEVRHEAPLPQGILVHQENGR